MNLDELRAVRDEERTSGELQPLRPSFYSEAREFIADVERERDRQFEASDEPLSDPAVSRLADKHSTAREVLASIFENRVAKLVRHAMTVAAGDEADPPPMTAEEAELYAAVVEAIESTKAAAIEGEGSVDDSELPIDDPPVDQPSASADDSPDEPNAVEDGEVPAETGDDRLLVRIVDDVGTILGVDEREYELYAGDVVSLPIDNARALLEREVAEPVENT